MAKYIGTLTSDARGKVGGIVMSRGRSGTALKAHGVGVHPRTSYQQSLRQTFGAALNAWRLLTDPNRTTWSLLAAQYTYTNTLGQTYSPTGLQLWTQAWVNAQLSNATPPGTVITTPPFINQITGLSVTRAGSTLFLGATQSGGGDYTGAFTASASSVIPFTRNYTLRIRRRPMGFTPTGPGISVTSAWLAAFGPLPFADSIVSVRAVPYDPVSYVSATPIILNVAVV